MEGRGFFVLRPCRKEIGEMPDDTPAETAPTPPGTGETPPAQPDVSAPAPGANGNPQTSPPTADIGAMQAALKKANAEAAASRKKVEAFEEAARQKALSELSEAEKAQQRIATLEKANTEAQAKLTAHERRAEFRKAAAKQKLAWANPQAEDDAFALSGLAQVTDEPPDVDALVKALAKDRPYLLQATTSPPNINGGDRPNEQPPVVPPEEQVELARRYGVKPELFKLNVRK